MIHCIHCGVTLSGDDVGGWLHDPNSNGLGVYRRCMLYAYPAREGMPA